MISCDENTSIRDITFALESLKLLRDRNPQTLPVGKSEHYDGGHLC